MTRIKPVFKYEPIAAQTPFAQARCLLTISVGQEVHESEKFAATIELVNNHFNSCILLIDDTLQRHTMVLNHSATADSFMDISRKEGDAWLRRNQAHYSQLTIPYQIIRWDRWLLHPDYVTKQSIIKKALQTDINYQAAFNQSIDTFLSRYQQRLSPAEQANFNYLRAYQLCSDYLLEECTAMCLWPELGCHVEVYPSKRNEAMHYTHQIFVVPEYPQLLHPVSIKFKQRKQLKPQQFSTLLDE